MFTDELWLQSGGFFALFVAVIYLCECDGLVGRYKRLGSRSERGSGGDELVVLMGV